MKFEKFLGTLAQAEKFNIKYNSQFPVKKQWYRYSDKDDRIAFISVGDWICYFDYDKEKLIFVSEDGYKAYKESHKDNDES